MIYLLRHGLDNEDYIGGHSDIDLIDLGVKQVKKSSLFIRNNLEIDNIISSDIKRCVSTSKIVRDSYYKHLPIYLDSSLRELDKGILTGRERKGLTEYEREIFNNGNTDIDYRFVGGESMRDMYTRVQSLLDSGYFLDKDSSLIVTHRGIINMIYFIFNEEELTLNKERFNVGHASIHEMDLNKRLIKRIY